MYIYIQIPLIISIIYEIYYVEFWPLIQQNESNMLSYAEETVLLEMYEIGDDI